MPLHLSIMSMKHTCMSSCSVGVGRTEGNWSQHHHCVFVAALSLMALKFIAVFGIMGIPIFFSLATCNEVKTVLVIFLEPL